MLFFWNRNVQQESESSNNEPITLHHSLIILYAVYFVAFLTTTASIYLFADDSLFISSLLFVVLGVAAATTHYFISKTQQQIKSLESYNSIFTDALKVDSEFTIIFNEAGDIVYSDPRVNNLIKLPQYKNLNELELISKTLQLSPTQIQKINDFIFAKADSKNNALVEYIKPNLLLLKPFKLHDSKVAITANNIKYYTVLKVKKFNEESDFNHMVDELGIGYYELDSTGHIFEANEYLSRTLGYKKKELLSEFKFENLIEKNESVLSFKKNQFKESYNGFLTLKTKFNEKLNVFIIQQAFYDYRGKLERITGHIIKLQDETLLLKSKGIEKSWIDYSWRCFFEFSPYPVAILDKAGTILRMNKALEDILPTKYVNKPFSEIFKDADRSVIEEEYKLLLSTEKRPASLKGLHILDSDRIFDIYMGKILDLDGQTYGFMTRIADITHEKELEDSLNHAQRMQTIGQLVGSVAHDFNNLLTAISGFCDLLLLKHHAGDPSFVNIQQIQQSATRATSLVRRLLAFSRKQTLKPEIVFLSELFSDFTTVIQRLIGSEINYELQISNNTWPVKIDSVQFEQVILNLAINARHAIGDRGNILIDVDNTSISSKKNEFTKQFNPSPNETLPAGDYVKIVVKDSGSGIKKEILPKIFDPFFTTKEEKSGTGLGLSTVYGIVKQSEGFIFVDTKIGSGTAFTILLKRHQMTQDDLDAHYLAVENKTKAEQAPLGNLIGKETILLVEDEDSVRLFAKNALELKGYNVIEYNSAKNALKDIEKYINKVDLIVSDVVMPEMTGPAFIKEVHARKEDIKVIFISGYGEDAFNEEYGQSRNFNLIAKPFSLKQLAQKVKEVIGS